MCVGSEEEANGECSGVQDEGRGAAAEEGVHHLLSLYLQL